MLPHLLLSKRLNRMIEEVFNTLCRVSQKTLSRQSICIQFRRMQFHMIRSFSSSPMRIKLCVFTHSSFKSDNYSKELPNSFSLILYAHFNLKRERFFGTLCNPRYIKENRLLENNVELMFHTVSFASIINLNKSHTMIEILFR